MTMHYIPVEIMALRLFLAAALAFIIGIDREIKEKPFGIRPYMMLSVGSAAFIMMLMELSRDPGMSAAGAIIIDPGRVIAGIIGGIGFMGAAAIIRGEQHIIGATTGTGIWVVGAVGVACGLGYYWYAGLLTAVAVLILVILGKLHARIQKRTHSRH